MISHVKSPFGVLEYLSDRFVLYASPSHPGFISQSETIKLQSGKADQTVDYHKVLITGYQITGEAHHTHQASRTVTIEQIFVTPLFTICYFEEKYL